MLAKTRADVGDPRLHEAGVRDFDEVAANLDPHEQRLAIGARAVDQEVRLGGAELDLDGAARRCLDARDVRDLEQIRLQRVDVLTDARHRGYFWIFFQSARNLPRPASVSGCLTSVCRTANGTVAICAPTSAASTMWLGPRTEATSTSVLKSYIL